MHCDCFSHVASPQLNDSCHELHDQMDSPDKEKVPQKKKKRDYMSYIWVIRSMKLLRKVYHIHKCI